MFKKKLLVCGKVVLSVFFLSSSLLLAEEIKVNFSKFTVYTGP